MGKKGKRSNLMAATKKAAASRQQAIATAHARSLIGESSKAIKGIMNSGNTCFFNSVVQALNALRARTQLWAEIESTSNDDISFQLAEVLSNLSAPSSKGVVNASMLLNAVAKKRPQFKGRRQQDAHELLVGLLSAIDEEANPSDNEAHKPTFADVFTSKLVSVVQCSGCGKTSCSVEAYPVVSLQLPGAHLLGALPVARKAAPSRTMKPAAATEASALASTGFNALASSSSDDELLEGSGGQHSDGRKEHDVACAQGNSSDRVSEVSTDTVAESKEREGVNLSIIQPAEPPVAGAFLGSVSVRASLTQCIDRFTSTEVLSPETGNGYACSNPVHYNSRDGSTELQEATRRLLFLDTADVLVFHLKRLLPGGKISAHVDFPERIDLTPYTGRIVEAQDSASTEIRHSRAQESFFTISAVVVHSGNQFGGHYVAFAKHRSRNLSESGQGSKNGEYVWYYTSDSTVRVASLSEVVGAQAYMLFYERDELNVEETIAPDKCDNGCDGSNDCTAAGGHVHNNGSTNSSRVEEGDRDSIPQDDSFVDAALASISIDDCTVG